MTTQEFLQRINEYENLLFSFALRLTRTRNDAEDLMQETKIKAFRHKNRFQPGTNFKGWISTIMRNTFINQYRKMKTRRHINQPVEDMTTFLENSNIISNAGEHNLRMEELHRLLSTMSDIYREPFMMFFQGYGYKEIAEHFQIPIGTVKSRIFLARKKMKELLGGQRVAAWFLVFISPNN